MNKEYFMNTILSTEVGEIPVVETKLSMKDIIGTLSVRLNIKRMKYSINPGIYAVGLPDKSSPVLVTANYKLTFDTLRKELSGINAWILVLDTKGINVWCAAGKGTFGTEELIQRIFLTGILDLIDHNTLILPQLGAPGVAAHKVKNVTGATIKYGPVRAKDLKEYLGNNSKITGVMREVQFNIWDRLILTPVELIVALPITLAFVAVIVLLKIIGLIDLMEYILPLTGGVFVGTVLTPVLLPFIPFRAFSLKGWFLGAIWAIIYVLLSNTVLNFSNLWKPLLIYLLLVPPISAFLALNFTGASTYTSPSGVKKEIKQGIVPMIVSAALGLILVILDLINII
jgi:hypothetical protein